MEVFEAFRPVQTCFTAVQGAGVLPSRGIDERNAGLAALVWLLWYLAPTCRAPRDWRYGSWRLLLALFRPGFLCGISVGYDKEKKRPTQSCLERNDKGCTVKRDQFSYCERT